MEETPEKKLCDAAAEGNATIFQQLLQQHPFLLDKVSFASTGKTPLHIAAAKGYVEIASLLLAESPNMCWSRDSHGMNPIHVAAMNGHADVLEKLLEKEPLAAMEKLDRGQTVMHLCAKHRQLRPLEVLVEKLKEFVCEEDDDGETVLHLAVRFRQVEMIEWLVDKSKIDTKSKNSKGRSALEVLEQSTSYSASDKTDETAKTIKKALESRSARAISYQVPPDEWLTKKRESIMVVAILTATMAFQIAVTPPGGVWQEPKPDDSSVTQTSSPSPLPQYRAGEAVIPFREGEGGKRDMTFDSIMAYNTVVFLSALSTILLLLICPMKHKFFIWALKVIMSTSLVFAGITFSFAIKAVIPKAHRSDLYLIIYIAIIAWAAFIAVLFLLTNYLWLRIRFLENKEFRFWPHTNCTKEHPTPRGEV